VNWIFKKSLLGGLIFALVVFADTAPAMKLNRGSARLEGMPYKEARVVIMGFGWRPYPGDCSGPDVAQENCKAFPEIDHCTGVEEGYCFLRFAKKGRCLTLLTLGGAPQVGPYGGDTSIKTVRFSRGSCAN